MRFVDKKNFALYVALSVSFIIVNVLTFTYTLPWNDEVELTDTVLNFVDYGQWISKAFPSYGGCPPFSMYVPLPQFLQTGWMLVFGNTMIAARSFNLFVVFIIGIIIIRLIYNITQKKIEWSAVLTLSLLLWGGAEFASIYRNGRGDVVGIVFSLLVLDSIICYLRNEKKLYLILSSIWASLLTWCALQACVLIVFAMICSIIVFKEIRVKLYKVCKYLLCGFIVGFLLLVVYFALNSHLMAFIHTIMALSGSLKKVAIYCLPIVGPIVGLNPEEWLEKANANVGTPGGGFFDKLFDVAKFVSYHILLIASIVIYWINTKISGQKSNFKNNEVLILIIFSILVPIFMTLAGRYAKYYWWMSYIPIIIAISIMVQKIPKRYLKVSILITSFVVAIYGVASLFNSDGKEKYIEIQRLCNRLPIKSDDVVSAPDFTLYEIRKKSDNCYFTKHYEVKYLDVKTVDYYLEYEPDIKEIGNTKKSRQFDKAIKSDSTITLEKIDRSDLLDLTVYKVHHK